MQMYLLSDNVDTRTGLRLAGINGDVVHTTSELKAAIDKAVSDPNLAILLITEKLSTMLPDYINNIKLTRKFPLIVEIPDRHGSVRSKDYITNFVREAIGVKLS